MRILLFMLAVFVVTGGISTGAKAENYPWCAYYSKGCTSCAFSTFEQCMADVSGIGGFCQQNNTYKPTGAALLQHKPRAYTRF